MITKEKLFQLFKDTRAQTENICAPLEIEDYVVQPIVDVSPPKWHLGHTTWFFEEFVLKKYKKDYQLFDEHSAFVFNSYYESVGEKVVRTDRGNLSRPTVAWIYKYRSYVTKAISELFEANKTFSEEIFSLALFSIASEKSIAINELHFLSSHCVFLPVPQPN